MKYVIFQERSSQNSLALIGDGKTFLKNGIVQEIGAAPIIESFTAISRLGKPGALHDGDSRGAATGVHARFYKARKCTSILV